MEAEKTLYKKLEDLGIQFERYEHEAAFTVEQMDSIASKLPPCGHCKNLFLKDSKKRLWLIVALFQTQIKLKEISKKLQAPELRFTDADLLMQHMGLTPGSVTPFGLINDRDHQINVLLDARLFDHDLVGFHPLRNTATTLIKPSDLQKFIASCGNNTQVIDFTYEVQQTL